MPRLPRPTRRTILAASFLLLAGAVVNVAVAWGIAASGQWPRRQRLELHASRKLPAPDAWPRACTRDVRWRSGLGLIEENSIRSEPNGSAVKRSFTTTSIRAGLPLPALQMYWHSAVSYPGDENYELAGPFAAFPAPDLLLNAGAFGLTWGRAPIGPLFPGFAINTLFYAAILALPLSVFPMRRRLRARRGRCPKCGYDLAGLGGADRGGEGAAPCPECGAAP